MQNILYEFTVCCGQRAVMLSWTVVYTARPVLAALQTSHRRRRDAAVVTARESQSRKARVLARVANLVNVSGCKHATVQFIAWACYTCITTFFLMMSLAMTG